MKNFSFIFKNIKPYIYGEQPKKIFLKLNTNENPFPPSLKIIKNLIKEIKFFGNKLKFYPDPNCLNLKLNLSKFYNIEINQIFLGNSSDEVLAHVFISLFKNKKFLLILDVTYSFYESYIKLYNIKYKILKLENNFKINLNNYKNNKNNIIITNPNANIGNYINKNKIEKLIIKNNYSITVLDEAYIDFKNESSLNLIKNYKNLLIVKTLSKSRSLASMRVGIAISNKKLIKNLNFIKNSFNSYPLNLLSQISSIYSYKDNIYFEKLKKIIFKNKNYLNKNLKKINFKILNSRSNFLLIKNKKINTNKLIKYLNKKNIFLRKIENPRIYNYIRISIDNINNCKIILKNIKNYINLNKK